jgi:hypothetical protein
MTCRSELQAIQHHLGDFADGFAGLAGVPNAKAEIVLAR